MITSAETAPTIAPNSRTATQVDSEYFETSYNFIDSFRRRKACIQNNHSPEHQAPWQLISIPNASMLDVLSPMPTTKESCDAKKQLTPVA
jgi:hypothetical protein